jgi:hypothetical protein
MSDLTCAEFGGAETDYLEVLDRETDGRFVLHVPTPDQDSNRRLCILLGTRGASQRSAHEEL